MAKATLQIEETVMYQEEVVLNIPENVSEEEFSKMLEELKKRTHVDSAKDIVHALKKEYGFVIEKQTNHFPDESSNHELEIGYIKYEK